MKRPPLKVFFCYAHEDRELRRELDAHLDLLEREGLVTAWFDGRIAPGTEWSAVIETNIRGADLVICLVSNAFLKSQYIAEVEIRLALDLQARGSARVIPVLLEPVRDFAKHPLGQLEALPSKARPLSKWSDRVRALEDIVHGIRRAAVDFLIETGGAFEFGSHAFTQAELARLPSPVRRRAWKGLERLRRGLVEAVPRRRPDRNLLIASWSLRLRRNGARLAESSFYLAQVLSSFDVVALQEVDHDLESIREVLGILGPEWACFLTDVKEGAMGNDERLGILYYRPRIAFEYVASEVVLPEGMLVKGRQFARKPLLASFRAGDFPFRVCTAHNYFGASTGEKRARAEEESRILAHYLGRLARSEREHLIVAGNFNMITRDSAAVRALRKAGCRIPPKTLHPSNIAGDRYYDLIGLFGNKAVEGPSARIVGSGSFNPFEHVFRAAEQRDYVDAAAPRESGKTKFEHWRTFQISDHRPVWLELQIRRPRGS